MLFREVGSVAGQAFTKMRSRRIAALVAPFALAASLTATSWAVPTDPVPVKDDPSVVEGAPTSHGAWFGWVQNSRRDTAHDDFYVQRGSQRPVRVNAARTEGRSGGIAGRHVYYVQQFRDRPPRIIRFDLATGHRSPLPSKVNHYHHSVRLPCCGGQEDDKHPVLSGVRGNATVGGSWVLYSGYMEELDHGQNLYYTVMLYNRATHQLRTVDAVDSYRDGNWAGQVNGRYATYWSFDAQGDGDVYRYDIKTRRTVTLPHPAGVRWDPSVSSDGTVYYIQEPDDVPADGPYTYELVRQPIGASAEVVRTLTTSEPHMPPSQTFVRDRPNGSRVVFFSWKDNVYKLVDSPPTTSSRPR